ncbi:MAG: phosphoribosylaminoimidazolesuccinocarboxamide synthase [Chloroflexi bacterium]|nr:phosphoribosylaminoimidazolesuccinocarboxamide synthase [Chloroflexota bacterium]
MATPGPRNPGTFLRSGKVRDLYALDDERLLLVASDRLSAFDVVLPTPIPDKGRVLTGLSRHWFAATAAAGLIGNHLLEAETATLSDDPALRGRAMVCRRTRVLPAECIVRGYLAGSGWNDYRATGKIGGMQLPAGLRESERLDHPIFTPSTKAVAGHDQSIDFDDLVGLVGGSLAERTREASLALYRFAARRTEEVGILLADTKFEFGIVDATGELLVIDEALTPDSSRFWDADAYRPGGAQASFDKQFVRDWLDSTGWAKRPPAPDLPAAVVEGTRARYVEAYERITGSSFAGYLATGHLDATV